MSNRVIQTLDVSATDVDIGEVLKRDGCVIIDNAMDHAVVDAMLADLADHHSIDV